jgi:hypothetical protein
MSDIFKSLIVIGGLLSILVIKIFYPSYEDDNFVEEGVEEIIKYKTDIDIDLTPMSSEKE